MPYRFVEGLTVADIAFEASGKTLEEMFASAAEAITVTQVQDIGSVGTAVEKSFEVKAQNEERLLHDFLQEIVFLKDAELLLFRKYSMRTYRTEGGGFRLAVKASGEKIDQKKHNLLVDVKAVSWHKFRVERGKDGWKATVIIDV